jgi:hypothetical protein
LFGNRGEDPLVLALTAVVVALAILMTALAVWSLVPSG